MTIDDIRINERMRDLDLSRVNDLAESIDLIGLLNPITVDKNNELISGLHRLEAYKLLGLKTIEVKVVNLDFLRCEVAEIDENIIRNDLNDIEIGEHLLRRDNLLEKMEIRAKRGDNRFTLNRPPMIGGLKTIKDVVKSVGISQSSIRLKKQIVKNLSPEVRDLLRNTKYATNTTGLLSLSKEDQGIQKRVVVKLLSDGFQDIKATISEVKRDEKRNNLINRLNSIRDPNYDGLILKCGDFREVSGFIKDKSVDIIMTDPPYLDQNSIELYEQVSVLGKRVLKDGGSCLCYVSQPFLPKVLEVMSRNLTYWWIISIKNGGNNGRHGRGIFVEWKPIVWFVKGKSKLSKNFVSDFIKSDAPEKLLHRWEQSTKEAEYYIDYLTPEDGVVLDVMMGTGTTGVSALRYGRDFIGIEKNVKTFEIAKGRILYTRDNL